MLEYEILFETETRFLAVEVRKAIAEGWEPLGGVSVTDDYPYVTQAMTRKPKRCPRCGGAGALSYYVGSPEKLTTCPVCDGTGTAPYPDAGSPGMKCPINLPCPKCEGVGTIPSPPEVLDNNDPVPCPECKGTGEIQKEKATFMATLILNLRAVPGNDPISPLCREAADALDAKDEEIKDLEEKIDLKFPWEKPITPE